MKILRYLKRRYLTAEFASEAGYYTLGYAVGYGAATRDWNYAWLLIIVVLLWAVEGLLPHRERNDK